MHILCNVNFNMYVMKYTRQSVMEILSNFKLLTFNNNNYLGLNTEGLATIAPQQLCTVYSWCFAAQSRVLSSVAVDNRDLEASSK